MTPLCAYSIDYTHIQISEQRLADRVVLKNTLMSELFTSKGNSGKSSRYRPGLENAVEAEAKRSSVRETWSL